MKLFNVKKGILAVVTKNTQEVSSKINKAKEMNILIISVRRIQKRLIWSKFTHKIDIFCCII